MPLLEIKDLTKTLAVWRRSQCQYRIRRESTGGLDWSEWCRENNVI